MFADNFTTYRPVLSSIQAEYDDMIAQYKVSKI